MWLLLTRDHTILGDQVRRGAKGMGKMGAFQAEQRPREESAQGNHTFQELKDLFYGQGLRSKERVTQVKAER